MKPSEVLRAAKALIATPETWADGNTARITGPKYCAGMAIGFALSSPRRDVLPLRCSVFRYFGYGPSMSDIGQWNDAPERTHSDVMAAFDRAIALAEANGE